jgi:hypothetical protein
VHRDSGDASVVPPHNNAGFRHNSVFDLGAALISHPLFAFLGICIVIFIEQLAKMSQKLQSYHPLQKLAAPSRSSSALLHVLSLGMSTYMLVSEDDELMFNRKLFLQLLLVCVDKFKVGMTN